MSTEQTRDRRPLLASSDLPPEVAVRTLGEALWNTVLDADAGLRDMVLKRLGGSDRLRLVVETDEPVVADLPWETLYLPSLRVMAGYTLKVSIVREVPESEPLFARDLSTPVRILAVSSDIPQFGSLPGARQELELLEQIFAEAVNIGP